MHMVGELAGPCSKACNEVASDTADATGHFPACIQFARLYRHNITPTKLASPAPTNGTTGTDGPEPLLCTGEIPRLAELESTVGS